MQQGGARPKEIVVDTKEQLWIAFGAILNKESQFSKNMKLQNGLQKDNYMM